MDVCVTTASEIALNCCCGSSSDFGSNSSRGEPCFFADSISSGRIAVAFKKENNTS